MVKRKSYNGSRIVNRISCKIFNIFDRNDKYGVLMEEYVGIPLVKLSEIFAKLSQTFDEISV